MPDTKDLTLEKLPAIISETFISVKILFWTIVVPSVEVIGISTDILVLWKIISLGDYKVIEAVLDISRIGIGTF